MAGGGAVVVAGVGGAAVEEEGPADGGADSSVAVNGGGLWPKAKKFRLCGMIFLQSAAGGLSSAASHGTSARRPSCVTRYGKGRVPRTWTLAI